jgi:hypothetical protein
MPDPGGQYSVQQGNGKVHYQHEHIFGSIYVKSKIRRNKVKIPDQGTQDRRNQNRVNAKYDSQKGNSEKQDQRNNPVSDVIGNPKTDQ